MIHTEDTEHTKEKKGLRCPILNFKFFSVSFVRAGTFARWARRQVPLCPPCEVFGIGFLEVNLTGESDTPGKAGGLNGEPLKAVCFGTA